MVAIRISRFVARPYQHTQRHSYAHYATYRDANTRCYSYALSHRDRNADGHGNADGDGDGHRDANANAHRHTDTSVAKPIRE